MKNAHLNNIKIHIKYLHGKYMAWNSLGLANPSQKGLGFIDYTC